ncbi:PASTA domain-containing protein [Paratractidigestivibacter sp.]|uniref:PASTA domain-containing protein n=1 Tax=Paratractidigestivibacter sp. TaxID=2847316 RepID=UPI002ABE2532|nr:PASTA domain-containing protein [Paratractidigestivibacter sp.]
MDTQDPINNADATQLMGAADAEPAEPADATQLMGAEPAEPDFDVTQLVGAAPTTVLPVDGAEQAADGIDALDDPLATPIDLEGLATVHTPVSVQSPVKSTKKKGLPVWGVALIVVLVLGALGGAGWYTYKTELWGGRTVPLVVGLDQATATTQLDAAGFKVTVEQTFADDGIGTVISCSPEPGSRAEASAGATITVAVARTIPQVTGQQMDAAQEALYGMGATNIRIQPVSSDSASGTVLRVSPSEGSTFKAADEVVLSVATPYVVPAVNGLAVDAAKTAIQKAGLQAKVEYIKSDKARNTVVESSPAAGTQAKEGDTVTLKVSSPFPDKVTSLMSYFDCTSQEIATYMTQEKYTITYGSTLTNGDAHAVYMGTDGDTIAFTAYPESPTAEGNARDDVLANGAPVGGVCYTFSSTNVVVGSEYETTDGVRAVMDECGLSGYTSSCTAADLEELGFKAEDRSFICGYGQMSDYYWAVIIGSAEDIHEVSAMVVPKSHFTSIDLTPYGGSIEKYIAYVYLYDDSSVLKAGFPATDTPTTEQKEGESSEQQPQSGDNSGSQSGDKIEQQ